MLRGEENLVNPYFKKYGVWFFDLPTGAVEKGKNNVDYMNNFLEAMLFWKRSEGEKKVRKCVPW